MESALEDQICAIIWVVMLSILNFPRAAVLLIKKYPLTTPSKHDQPCNMTTAMNVHDTLRNVVSPGHDRKDSNTKWHESICHRSCFQSWHNTLCFQASHGISLFCSGLPNTEAILRDELGRRGIIYECIRFAHNVAERLGQCQRAIAGFVSVLVAPFARFRILWYYAQSWTSSNSMPDVWAW